MSMLRLTPRLWLWAALLMTTLGCGDGGPKLVPVKGTVTIDGQPQAGVVLLFHGANSVSTASSDASGGFSIVTNAEPGIPAGTYKVTASWPEAIESSGGGMGATPDTPDRLKGKFMIVGQSQISVDVTDTTTEIPAIELATK